MKTSDKEVKALIDAANVACAILANWDKDFIAVDCKPAFTREVAALEDAINDVWAVLGGNDANNR